jgi:hypothetical protein
MSARNKVIFSADRTVCQDLGVGHAMLCPPYVRTLFSGNRLRNMAGRAKISSN